MRLKAGDWVEGVTGRDVMSWFTWKSLFASLRSYLRILGLGLAVLGLGLAWVWVNYFGFAYQPCRLSVGRG